MSAPPLVHMDQPLVECNRHTLALLGSPPQRVRVNLSDHTVKWTSELEYGVVRAAAPLSWPLVVQTLLGGSWPKGIKLGSELKRWILEEIEGRLPDDAAKLVLDSPEYRPDAPPPRDYQMEAAAMLSGVGRGFLFDDPGTGKTLSSILAVLRLRQRNAHLAGMPVLVVCPPSVVDSWIDAWTEWTTLTAVAWRGPAGRRRNLAGTADVYVTGYTTVRNDATLQTRTSMGRTTTRVGPLLELGMGCLIMDEIQGIKNPRSVQSVASRRLAAHAHVLIGLSGTPITHNVGDIWPALNALDPIAWPSRERFVKRYLAARNEGYAETVEGFIPEREPEYRASLAGQTRRVSKEDVLSSLPPKVYSVRTVDVPQEHKNAYDSMERDMLAMLPNGDELTVMDALAVITRLLQLSCSAAEVEYTTELVPEKINGELTGNQVEKEHVKVTLVEPSWKIDELVEVVAERVGRQGLVFSPSAQLTRLAAARLESEGKRVGMIIGGQKPEERTAVVKAFQAGELDLICATTQSGGTGLTLTAASYVVFLQRPWSYGDSLQAEDRAHRIGSEIHDSIEIIDIVARGTIDTRIRQVIKGKSEALGDLLQDSRIMEQCLGEGWKSE